MLVVYHLGYFAMIFDSFICEMVREIRNRFEKFVLYKMSWSSKRPKQLLNISNFADVDFQIWIFSFEYETWTFACDLYSNFYYIYTDFLYTEYFRIDYIKMYNTVEPRFLFCAGK